MWNRMFNWILNSKCENESLTNFYAVLLLGVMEFPDGFEKIENTG